MTGSKDQKKDPSPRASWAILAGLLLVQLFLSLTSFTSAPHTGGDNAGYLGLAHSLAERGTYQDLYDPAEPPHTKYPPVFPGILAGAILLGANGWTAFKALSVLFVTLSVLLSFLWVRERRGAHFAFGVALLLALSSAFLSASRWILSDPSFLFLTILSLWAFHRGAAGEGGEAVEAAAPRAPPSAGVRRWMVAGPTLWTVIGCSAAILAYFTRSAGIPLVIAAAVWLGLRRQWRILGGFVGVFVALAALWWLRGRGAGVDGYVSEFWLVNPYEPAEGRVGVADLVKRVVQNLWGYAGTHIPGGITGVRALPIGIAGLLLTGFALVGWGLRARRRATVAELFFPLYFGLILLWPVVWSGDRFALPLYPLLLFYGAEALLLGARRLHPALPTLSVLLAAVFLGAPALRSWSGSMREAGACRPRLSMEGPYACHAPPVRQFVESARWSGENLPEGSVVFSRKPRIFFLLSGVRSQMYPLSADPELFLSEAVSSGARYLVLDHLDRLGSSYLVPIIQERPELFCGVVGIGTRGGLRTDLLGILPEEERRAPREEGDGEEGGIAIGQCPASMRREVPRPTLPYSPSSIPLLVFPEPER